MLQKNDRELQVMKDDLEIKLQAKFMEWDAVRENGSVSPAWTDGQALNYIRTGIERIKHEMEEVSFYPEIYHRETPPKMPFFFMVDEQKIRKDAETTLEACRNSGDFQYLFRYGSLLPEEMREQICLDGIFHNIFKMEEDIRKDRLVEMKKYWSPGRYLQDIRACRMRLEELLEELKELGDLEPGKKEQELQGTYIQMELRDFVKG